MMEKGKLYALIGVAGASIKRGDGIHIEIDLDTDSLNIDTDMIEEQILEEVAKDPDGFIDNTFNLLVEVEEDAGLYYAVDIVSVVYLNLDETDSFDIDNEDE